MGFNEYCTNCRYYIKGKCTLTGAFMDKLASCTKYKSK